MKKIILILTALLSPMSFAQQQGQFIPYDQTSEHAQKRIAEHAKFSAALSANDRVTLREIANKYKPRYVSARKKLIGGELTREIDAIRSEQFAEISKRLSPRALQAMLKSGIKE